MTPPLDKVTLLMTLVRQLTQVLEAETEALRRLNLVELPELQAERQALADIYHSELRDVRTRPEILGAVNRDSREELECATRLFQDAARRNGQALLRAQRAVEGALQGIAASLAENPGARADALRPNSGQIVPFALDRGC